MERTGTLWWTFFQQHLSFCQSVRVVTSPAVRPFWEYWNYIRYCKRRAGTSSPWTCNIRWTTDEQAARLIAQLSHRRMERQWWRRDEMIPLHVPERGGDGIDVSMMAHNWSASLILGLSPVLGERGKTFWGKYTFTTVALLLKIHS